MSSTPRRFLAAHATALLVGVSFLTLAFPFLFAAIPPLTDYPNHLARFFLIGGGDHDASLAHFYRIDWTNAVTNVGVDRVVAFLAPLGSALALGRLAVITAAILPPLGVLALNMALTRRLSPWQALFPLAAWSTTLLMGFLNFQIGLGLALLCLALDPLAQPRLNRWWALMRAPFGLILSTDHLFGLIFYAILLAGLGMGPEPLTPWDWKSLARRFGRAALTAAWCLIPLVLMVSSGHSDALPGAQPPLENIKTPIEYNMMPGKLATLFSALASYNLAQEVVVALALVGLFVWLNRRRALVAHTGLMVACAGMIAVAVFAPSRAAGASWVDRRFPIMALFCLLAALRLRDTLPKRFITWVGVVALGLAALQSAWVAFNWRALDANMKTVIRVLADVPAGARILPLQQSPSIHYRWSAPAGRYMFGVGDPTFRHFDCLAVTLRRAFVPNLFSARGLQPLRVLGDWDGVVDHNGGDLNSVNALTRAPLPGEESYIPGWRTRYDYVLVLNADLPDQSGPFHPPPELTLVSDGGFAQLWRIAPHTAPAP